MFGNRFRWLLSATALVMAASGCSSEPVEPAQPGDLGLRPTTDGFSFENYGNEVGTSRAQNLTSVEMRRLFGDGVCASPANDACTLTPQAREWMAGINKEMSDGHCEGMAVLSDLFFARWLKPSDFGADVTPDLEIEGNAGLQREIALWFSTQFTEPTTTATMKSTPREVADQLAQAFGEDANQETYTVGFYKKDLSGGHTVTPYAVVPEGDGVVKIMVYDSNYPKDERAIEVDRIANTWRYNGAQNPGEAEAEYFGDATSKTLEITPTSARLQQQQCEFCEDLEPGAPAPEGRRQLQHLGGGNVVIRDEPGNETGMRDGRLVNDIPGAEVHPVKSGGPAYWKQKRDPIYKLPGKGALTVTLDGSSAAAASESDVSMMGPGYLLAVEGIDLEPDQKDTITFSADSTKITYETTSLETPVLVLGAQLAGPDYLFRIRAHGTGSGVYAGVAMDLVKGKLAMTFDGARPQGGYDIEVHRIGDSGEAVFTHAGNNPRDGDVIYLDYGVWQGQGSPMTIETDRGGNGSIDSTEVLGDEG